MNMVAKKTSRKKKGPGRIKQMLEVLRLTCRYDHNNVWMLVIAGGIPLLLAIILAIFISEGSVVNIILWIIAGILVGLILFMITLGRRAEKMAYAQIEGQPGATGAVLKSLRGIWRGSDEPIAVNARTKDALYRTAGRCGVVIIVEGMLTRSQKMASEEHKRINRLLPNVPVTVLNVNHHDPEAIPLAKLSKRLKKLKRVLKTKEVQQISSRLDSLSRTTLPIPKGIDPLKARPPKKAKR